MERWGVPEPRSAQSAPTRPTGGSDGARAGHTRSLPGAGFGAAFQALADRKLRELGGTWQQRSSRARRAEAVRRATHDMAGRVERQSGRRPAESTLRRNARTNRAPRGVDPEWLDRQARIDEAGGVKVLAQLLGVSQYAVRRWRDDGRPLVPGALIITADVEGVLIVNGEEYPRSLTVSVTIYPPAADDVRVANALGDMDRIAELLGPEIAAQVDWAGDADREYTVTEIVDISLH